MNVPVADQEYHVLAFERTNEAAAFVAALARYLNSPAGAAFVKAPATVEVWSYSPSEEKIEVYLSEGALAAVAAVFTPVPVIAKRRGAALPKDCVMIIGGGQRPAAWGLAEAERRLTAR
jgi:hypothetical protein